jgi:hypothetical protein
MRSLTLQSNSTIVASGDEVGKLSFAASSEIDGLSAISVGARVIAQAEGSFQSASNPTSLVFATASSTAGAIGKIKITDNGNVMPMTNNTYDIGDQNLQFRNIYASSGNFTSLNASGIVLSQTVSTDGSPTALTLTGAAHTTLTASTEATDLNFNLARTVQFATGALTTQRAMRIQAPTYGFVGASTITTASTLSISGPPVAGTNATITSAYVLNVESGTSNFGGEIILNSNKLTFGSSSLVGNVGAALVWTTNYTVGFRVLGESTGRLQFSDSGITLNANNNIAWTSSDDSAGTKDLYLYRDAAGTLALRNAANVQSFGVYGTWTSTTSYERINVRGKASANFEIGPENGSTGGTLRGLTIGGYSAGTTTIAPWLSFTNAGAATFAQELNCSNTTTVTNANIHVERYGASISSVRFRKAQGTSGSPTQALSADIIGVFGSYGYHNGSAFHTLAGAYIGFVAAEDITSTGHGSLIKFATTPIGSTISATSVQIESSGVTKFYKLACHSETTNTPSGTTQTITLDSGNHQTLALTSATGTVTATLTVPTGSSAGSIIVRQHASAAKDIVWAVSAGTIKWMGAEPDWAADAIDSVRIVSWRYNGSVIYLASTDVAV